MTTTTATPHKTLSERVDRLVRSHSDSWPPLHSAATPVAIAEIIDRVDGLEQAIHAMALEIQRLATEEGGLEARAFED